MLEIKIQFLKCKYSFENQEVGRHLENGSQITSRGTVSKAISIFCKLSHLGGIKLCFTIFVEVNLEIGIQIGIIQAGMTNWEIKSRVIKVLVEVMPMIITNEAKVPR